MSTLSLSEQQDLRTTVEGYFGKHNTAHWEMNSNLMEVVRQMRAAEQSCSTAMDFVPRPGSYLAPKAVVEEVKKMAKRALQGGNSTYLICRAGVIRNWHSVAEDAATFP